MTALDIFLYGMPLVLMAGAGVTLWFAKRAARDIESHSPSRQPLLFVVPTTDQVDTANRTRVGAL